MENGQLKNILLTQIKRHKVCMASSIITDACNESVVDRYMAMQILYQLEDKGKIIIFTKNDIDFVTLPDIQWQ